MGEWPLRTIGDLVTLQRGIDLPDHSRTHGDVPIMGSFGVTGRHNVAACRGPGVTVGRSGASAGTVCYIEEDYWPLNTCLYVRDFKNNDPRFAYYFLKTVDLAGMNSGSAQPSLNRNFVHPMPVRFPEPAEQRQIAAVLSALDDKIELNRRMNETLEASARELFRDWFVDFGPTRAKAEGRPAYLAPDLWSLFPDRLGDDGVPEGWRLQTLADCCSSIFSGGTPSTTKPEYWNGGVPWLSSGETRNLVAIDTERTITMAGVAGSSTRLALAGSSVIASAGQGNTRGQAAFLANDMYINQSVIACHADPRVSTHSILFFDISRRYDQFRQISDSNSSRGSLTTTMVGGLPAIVVTQNTIKHLSRPFDDTLDRIIANIHESRTLAETRDALLPKLMTGEIRIASNMAA